MSSTPEKNLELRRFQDKQIYLCIAFMRGVYDGFMGQENQQHTKQSSPTFSQKKKTRCFSKAFHVPKRHPAAMVLSELCWEPHSNFFRENSPPPFTTLSTLLVVSFHKNMSNWLISAEFLPFWGVKNKKKIFYDHRMWPPSTSQKPGGLS